MTARGSCWIEPRNDAQKFEDGVNVKVGEGFKNIQYQYTVYQVNGQVKEVYSALMCK